MMSFAAVYLKASHSYVDLLEELPGVNSQGRTINEARPAGYGPEVLLAGWVQLPREFHELTKPR